MKQNFSEIKGVENFPLFVVFLYNLFIVLYLVVGMLVLWPLKIGRFPIASLLYAAFAVLMLGFVLRKELCTGCYYYNRWCATGWGKLAAFLFKRKNLSSFQRGIKLANKTWTVLILIPVMVGIFLLIFNYTSSTLLWLLLFIVLSGINFVAHKKTCAVCKMRYICPASLVKK
jgi:hypothetical protein